MGFLYEHVNTGNDVLNLALYAIIALIVLELMWIIGKKAVVMLYDCCFSFQDAYNKDPYEPVHTSGVEV